MFSHVTVGVGDLDRTGRFYAYRPDAPLAEMAR